MRLDIDYIITSLLASIVMFLRSEYVLTIITLSIALMLFTTNLLKNTYIE
jgi:hypothetical protein